MTTDYRAYRLSTSTTPPSAEPYWDGSPREAFQCSALLPARKCGDSYFPEWKGATMAEGFICNAASEDAAIAKAKEVINELYERHALEILPLKPTRPDSPA